MLKYLQAALALVMTLVGSAAAGLAQPIAGPSGHWEGALQAPGQEIRIQIDLAPLADKWQGTISIPVQGLKGFPLSGIDVQGMKVAFAMQNVPGNPEFTGTLSNDAKTLSGELRQGGGTIPFSLTRTGDANFERLPDSTPVTKAFEGAWEGTLDVDGNLLRLALNLANTPGGRATATLVSVDQGGAKVPVAAVVQSGDRLKLSIPAIVGTYVGDMKDGVLTGTWTQGPRTWPLVFSRPK
jgi:hypothetical protein